MIKNVAALALFIGFLSHNLYCEQESVRLKFVVPEVVKTKVSTNILTQKHLQKKKVPKKLVTVQEDAETAVTGDVGAFSLGQTEVALLTNALDYQLILSLDNGLSESLYLTSKSRFKLVSQTNPDQYITLRTIYTNPEGVSKEIFFKDMIAESKNERIDSFEPIQINFWILEDQFDLVETNTTYSTTLNLEIRSTK